jgi:hypothetical protein
MRGDLIGAGTCAFIGVLVVLLQIPAGTGPAQASDRSTLVETGVHRWGFGIEQAIDSANLLLYAQAHAYDPTIVGFPCNEVLKRPCGTDNKDGPIKLPAASWQGFVIGARIQF